MKTLTDYIIQESLIFENANGEIITEGFWKKLGSALGFSSEKVSKTMKNWKDDLKRGYTTGQYLAVKSKDKEIKKDAEEQAKAAEKGSKELLDRTKLTVQRLMKEIKNLKYMDFCWSQYVQLTKLSEQENDNEGKELAKKFKGAIDKKWPDAESNYDKVEQKIEKAGVDEGPKGESNGKENTDQPKSDEKADLGGGDKDNPNGQAVSSEQQKNAINNDIKENVDFFKQLAQESGLKGEDISGMIQGLINTSFKEQDKDGNWKWKIKNAHGIFGTEEQEQKFVKGLGAILCGAVIINHSAMTEAIHGVLEKLGFKKANIINKLKEIAKK